MINIKMPGYYDAKTTYLGIAETVNPNAGYREKQVISKIVVLTKIKNRLEPMYSDYEYYNLIDSQPAVSYLDSKEKGLFGFINEAQLQKAISRTGLKEANRLTKENEKVLRKVA